MGDSGLYQEVRNVTVTGIIESVHLLHLPSKDSLGRTARVGS